MFSRRSILGKTATHIAQGVTWAGNPGAIPQLASEIGATIVASPPPNSVNVVDFGADPRGVADASDAISRAIERCFAVPDATLPAPLYFPAGRFLINRNNVFRSIPRLHPIYSWDILGAGQRTTTLIFKPADPSSSIKAFYLYDGYFDENAKDNDSTLLGLRLSSITVQLDCTGLSPGAAINCFRQFGSGRSGNPEQNWTFLNCSFRGDEKKPDGNGTILQISGDANGSENAFINCRGIRLRHVIDCTNPQAVNHLSLFCHWEVILGDMFRFVRGGNLTLFGGSLILTNFGDAPEWKPQTAYAPDAIVYHNGRRFRTREGGKSGDQRIDQISSSHFDGGVRWYLDRDESAYLLRVGGDLTGQINSFLISGTRIELRSNKAKLLAGGDLNTGALVTFDSVAVQPVVGGPRHTIELSESSASINFSKCKLSRASSIWEEPLSIRFGRGPNSQDPRYGTKVLVEGCVVSESIHNNSSWDENSRAELAVQNCVIGYRESPNKLGQSHTSIIDGKIMAPGRARSGGVPRYARHLRVPLDRWPGSLPDDSINVSLPPQATLLKVHFVKFGRGLGIGAEDYRLFLRDSNGNELFRSSSIDISGPFEIETPRLYAQSLSGTLRLSIGGTDYKVHAIEAGPNDCIVLDWIA